MKISEQQLQALMIILRESLSMVNFFTIPNETREKLYKELWNQQSTELIEVNND